MAEYIDREAFMHFLVKQHCENCDKRKGMKNGKERFVYEIGDAPCRSCGVDDALDYIEYFPAADVQPVLRCKDCKEWHRNYLAIDGGKHGCELFQDFTRPDDFCSFGTRMDGET